MAHTTHLSPSDVPRTGGGAERFSQPFKQRLSLDRLLWADRSLALKLLPGVAAIGATALLGMPFLGAMERGPAFFAFFPAIILASLLGRLAGGTLAALLTLLLVGMWIVPFQGAPNPAEVLPFLGACTAVVLLAGALHRVHGRAFDAARESAEFQTMAAALAEREAWLNAVLDGVADGIVTIDERGTIKSINRAATTIFGYEPEEVAGSSVNMLMPEFCREAHDRYLAEHVKSGKAETASRRRQVEGRRKDGSVFPMDCGVSDIHLDGRRLFVGIVRDITERIRAEEALQASAEFSRTVLEFERRLHRGHGLRWADRIRQRPGFAAYGNRQLRQRYRRTLDGYVAREGAASGGDRHCHRQRWRDLPLLRLPSDGERHAEILGRAPRSRPR